MAKKVSTPRTPVKKSTAARSKLRRGIPQRQPKKKVSDEKLMEAIRFYKGNLHAVARSLGLRAISELRFRINKNDALREALADGREELLGKGESMLEALLDQTDKDGNPQPDYRAVKDVLANFGRHAGWQYEEKLKVETNAQAEVEVFWNDSDPTIDEE